MATWWSRGLSGEDRDEWCTALDTGEISEDLLITLTSEGRTWIVDEDVDDGRVGYAMRPDFQAFVAEECAKRLR